MIRIAIIEDHPVFRSGLAGALAADDRFDVVSSFETVPAFIISSPAVDVIVLDLALPGTLFGAAAVASLVSRGYRILVLSASAASNDVVSAYAEGASGYVTKSESPEQIGEAISTVAGGGQHIPPSLAGFVLQRLRVPKSPLSQLTKRELEVLELFAQGESRTEIAHSLCLSPRTIDSHLDRIRDKLGERQQPKLAKIFRDHRPT